MQNKALSHSFFDRIVLSLLVFIITVFTPSIVSFSSDLKFLLLSAAGFYFIAKLRGQLQFHLIDFSWAAFIILSSTSYLWAIDGSLMWNQTMGWVILFGWVIISRYIYLNYNYADHLHTYLSGLFIICLAVFLFYLSSGLSTDIQWVKRLGYNRNYSSSYLIGLLPFILYLPQSIKVRRASMIIVALLIACSLLVVFYTSTRAVLLAFMTVFLIKFLMDKQYKLFITVGGLFLIGTFVIIFSSSYTLPNIGGYGLLSDLQNSDDISRKYLMKASLWLFQENPLLGIGSGNWHLEVYKYNLTEIPPFNSPDFLRHFSHNLYSTVLAESGIIGFGLLIMPIAYLLRNSFMMVGHLSNIEKAFLMTIIVYLITSFFYGTTNFRDAHFSGLQWLAFTGLGVLSSKLKPQASFRKPFGLFLVVCSTLSFIWYSYAAVTNKLLYDAKKEINQGSQVEGVERLKSIYNPVLKGNQNTTESLPFLIAKNLLNLGEIAAANEYYETALLKSPYNAQLLHDFATFLLYDKNEVEKSSNIANRLLAIDSENKLTHLLLGRIALAQEELNRARTHLNKAYHPWYTYKVNMLEQSLYKSQYLSATLNIKSKPKLIEKLLEFEPLENLSKIREQKWSSINSLVVRSIYNFEFTMFQNLDSLEYDAYLRDKLNCRVDFELSKIEKDLNIMSQDLAESREAFILYAMELERISIHQKSNTGKYKKEQIATLKEHQQEILLSSLRNTLDNIKIDNLRDNIATYNFGKHLFCTEQ